MSFTWRSVVRLDGSFCRFGNVDGSLDNVSDEELARLQSVGRDQAEAPDRPCSRCGGDLLLRWHGASMTGVWMELCPACDARRPAGRAFIQWYRDQDREPKALPQLFEDWETETMHAHGWARAPQPEATPGPTAHPSLVPRGQG
ncbi:hypothetical protein GCM10011583_74230 [Streptomyces camponoticapitis]|uniref:Uncharacterized protein n=1 Tax=Streptomyces camponoticapitis TaxID=1616125 RepID=A0ABQ2EY45_9ACTN|nr:DUF6300 family protein [Streptomyces camponoticapitis]GGK31532.1 hypothetical protein GCM10011583_74230 [Streptomyces camponoticapitis]